MAPAPRAPPGDSRCRTLDPGMRRIRQSVAGLAGAAVVALTVAATAEPSIVGGRSATMPYPWIAALYHTGPGGAFFCAGSLIAPNWVLTAAHCVSGYRWASDLSVRVGSASRSRGGSTTVARRLVPHP